MLQNLERDMENVSIEGATSTKGSVLDQEDGNGGQIINPDLANDQ